MDQIMLLVSVVTIVVLVIVALCWFIIRFPADYMLFNVSVIVTVASKIISWRSQRLKQEA